MQVQAVDRERLRPLYDNVLNDIKGVYSDGTPIVMFTSAFLMIQAGVFDEVEDNPFLNRGSLQDMVRRGNTSRTRKPKFRGVDVVFVDENIIYASGWVSPHHLMQLFTEYKQTSVAMYILDPLDLRQVDRS